MSALGQYADQTRTTGHVRYVPILLQKSVETGGEA
jgi:hypothetical protein